MIKQIMKSFFLLSILVIGLICIIAETDEGVVYYVSPTESLNSCTGNSSCPPGQLCHTMDYLVEHSSEFFSPEHVNVMLIFMCGVHNYTKDLSVQKLHSFVMKGTAESKENVIIDHHFVTQLRKLCEHYNPDNDMSFNESQRESHNHKEL